MKRKTIIGILLMMIGIVLICYPIISNQIFLQNQEEIISEYEKSIDNMSEEEKKEELRIAKKYNDNLKKNSDQVDISLEEKNEKDKKNGRLTSKITGYTSVLNNNGIMAYISIPKINVYLPIYHGVSKSTLRLGVGHIESTSLPIGGMGTHCVLAGHSGMARKKVFDNINKLKIGDEFYIYVFGEKLTYMVDKIDTVKPNNTNAIKTEEDKDFITLVTCTPRFINTHRLLVRGTRIT